MDLFKISNHSYTNFLLLTIQEPPRFLFKFLSDPLVTLVAFNHNVIPLSTVSGATILNGVFAEAVILMVDARFTPHLRV